MAYSVRKGSLFAWRSLYLPLPFPIPRRIDRAATNLEQTSIRSSFAAATVGIPLRAYFVFSNGLTSSFFSLVKSQVATGAAHQKWPIRISPSQAQSFCSDPPVLQFAGNGSSSSSSGSSRKNGVQTLRSAA